MLERIAVVGSGGAGKSTLAVLIAARLGMPHTELDSLYWGPGWQPVSPDEFQARVARVTDAPRWVVCGNYSRNNTTVLSRADTMVWLDYPLALIWWRLLQRTIGRASSGAELWETGNRETWRNAFFSRESLLLYILRTHKRRSAHFEALMTSNAHPNLSWLRFRSPRQTEAWLARIAEPHDH